ncbi:MAG TPA: AEC family transporter [Mariprofundaceae bacterium]|nr:AEC family transporter [Mariprofundaceae bacterium]
MLSTLFGMAAIILAGIAWRLFLGGQAAETVRGHLAQAVYQVFLPALVVHVLWQTPVNLNAARIPIVAAACVLLSLIAAALIYGNGRLVRAFMGGHHGPRPAVGALLLAAAFGNVTYLGLPVLTQTFGTWSQFIAIQFDLLANTPLLFTVGILVARHFGTQGGGAHPFMGLVRVPAVWAAICGLSLSALSVHQPAWLSQSLATLGSAVVPLMLLSVGMAMRWQAGWAGRIPVLFPVLVIQLVLMPLIAWGMCHIVDMPERLRVPVLVEAAMPSMVLGLVLCDRFRLDSGLYAEAVTLSTVLSMLTLPVWLAILG